MDDQPCCFAWLIAAASSSERWEPISRRFPLASTSWVKSAIRSHLETFGQEILEVESPILEAFVAEAQVSL